MTTATLPAIDRQHPARSLDRPSGSRPPIDSRAIVALLTVVALGIRLVIVRGFWLDEATSGYDSRLSYGAMLHQLQHDNHPPLEYSILWLTAHTIGSTQTDLRLSSIAFGTALIPMLYLAGKALYHERAGVLAAAFGTVGALAVWYAQEARMYALFMLLATVTIWAVARIVATQQRRYWALWALAGAAMIWTQWFASLAVGTEILILAVVLLRDRPGPPSYRRFGAAVTAVVVLCAPGIPLLLTQFQNNQSNGLGFGSHGSASATAGFSPYGIFNNLIWALFGYHSNGAIAAVVAIWPLGLLAALVILGRGRNPSNRILAALIIVPMAIAFLASSQVAPSRSLFEIRYFIEAVPAIYLLLAGAVWTMTPSRTVRRIFTALLLIGLTGGLVAQQTDSANPRLYGYNEAFEQIRSVAHPGDLLLYAPQYLDVDVAYFAPDMRAEPVTAVAPTLSSTKQIFVFGSFNFVGVNQADTTTQNLLRTLGRSRHLNAVFQAPNVTVWEFA